MKNEKNTLLEIVAAVIGLFVLGAAILTRIMLWLAILSIPVLVAIWIFKNL